MRRPGVPTASSAVALNRMKTVRRRDTTAEVAIRRLLHAQGHRYRVDRPAINGTRRRADLIFATAHVAVFIDGCFWHSCPQHATHPKANAAWWAAKLAANRHRDADTDRQLAAAGWKVVRVWEHEAPNAAAARIARAVRARQPRNGRVQR